MNHCTPVAIGETLVSARVVNHDTDHLPRIQDGKVKDWALDGPRGLSWGCVVLRNDAVAVLYNDAPGRVEGEGLVTGLGDRWRRVRRMRRRQVPTVDSNPVDPFHAPCQPEDLPWCGGVATLYSLSRPALPHA